MATENPKGTKFLLFVFVFNFLFRFAGAFCLGFLLPKMVSRLFSCNLYIECRVLCQNGWNWTKTMLYHCLRSDSVTGRGHVLPFCLLSNREVIIKCPPSTAAEIAAV